MLLHFWKEVVFYQPFRINTRFFNFYLQEHQDNILGNTTQTAVALLNNVVTSKSTNMMLLFAEGMSSLPL